MSFEAMAMVVTVEDISPVDKLILLLLSNYADENYKCFPSYDKISKLANCSRRTAVRSINRLEETGHIRIKKRKLSNNDNQSNIYTINRPSVKLSPASDKDSIESSDTVTPPSDTMSPNTITLNNQVDTINKDRFSDFWNVYPKGHKSNKKGCLVKWKLKKLDLVADQIIADVQTRTEQSKKWKKGFIPAPITYLNQERWHDDVDTDIDTESFEYMNMVALGVIDEKKSEVA
jgi:DNA-binding transcriptional MocR family regulator